MSGEKQEECALSIGMQRACDLEHLRRFAVEVLATTPKNPNHFTMLAGQFAAPPQSRVECGARTQSCTQSDGCDEGEDHNRGTIPTAVVKTRKLLAMMAHVTSWVLINIDCLLHVTYSRHKCCPTSRGGFSEKWLRTLRARYFLRPN